MLKPRKPKRSDPKPPEFWQRASVWLKSVDPLDRAAAFSLSHLVFLRIWADHLIPLENAYFNYTRHSATPANVAGLWLASAALFFPFAQLFRWSSREQVSRRQFATVTVSLLFAIQAVVVFNLLFKNDGDAFHAKNFFGSGLSSDAIWILIVESVAIFGWALLLHGPKLIKAVRLVLVLLAPFPFLVTPQILANNASSARSLTPTAPASHHAKLNRTVVVVMDELDYSLVFENEKTLAEFPNFAALKKESLFATQALPPSQNTLLSLPSYWYGKNVSRITVPLGEAPQFQFFETTHAGRSVASTKDLFSEAASAGATTEIVGWSHPYCDLFSSAVRRCYQSSYQQGNNGVSVGGSFAQAFARFADVLSLAGITDPSFIRSAHLAAYQEFLNRSLSAVANPQNDLVWLHLPVPHEPIIYNRSTQAYRSGGFLLDGAYPDNVALADRTLGALKARLQEAGLWEETRLLLVSDHAYRHTAPGETGADQQKRLRVPFLLKTNSHAALPFTSPFSTRVVGPLALHLLKGELSTGSSVWRWLDHVRQEDQAFLRTAYAGGRRRCVDYPFTSEAKLFDLWSRYDARCAATSLKISQ